MNSIIDDMLYFPKWGRGAWCVWRRNFLYFRQTIFTALSWTFLEPLLYLFSLGYGLGTFVPEIDGKSYAEFIAPALLTTTAMFVGFFEGTYGTFTKLNRQNTFQTILLTPVMPDEIVLGEILWATFKSFFSVLSVALVVVILNLIPIIGLVTSLPVLLLLCWLFAALGVLLAGVARSYETFTYFTSGLITPMSLFCGTYFPLSRWPEAVHVVIHFLPLTHGLSAVRMILDNAVSPNLILHLSYLLLMSLLFTNMAASKMKNKLIY